MDGISTESSAVLFSPTDSFISNHHPSNPQQPLTIQIAQQTRNFFWKILGIPIDHTFLSLAYSHLSDMSSPIPALDSPMSDDYSNPSVCVLDTNSLSGLSSGDALASTFNSK